MIARKQWLENEASERCSAKVRIGISPATGYELGSRARQLEFRFGANLRPKMESVALSLNDELTIASPVLVPARLVRVLGSPLVPTNLEGSMIQLSTSSSRRRRAAQPGS